MFGLKTSRKKNVIQTNLTKQFPQEGCPKERKIGPPLLKQQLFEPTNFVPRFPFVTFSYHPKLTIILLQRLLACRCDVVSWLFFVHFVGRQIWFKFRRKQWYFGRQWNCFSPVRWRLWANRDRKEATAYEESMVLEEERNLELQTHFTGVIGAW